MPACFGILPSCCRRLFRWFAKLFFSADCFVWLVIHSHSRSALFRLNVLSLTLRAKPSFAPMRGFPLSKSVTVWIPEPLRTQRCFISPPECHTVGFKVSVEVVRHRVVGLHVYYL